MEADRDIHSRDVRHRHASVLRLYGTDNVVGRDPSASVPRRSRLRRGSCYYHSGKNSILLLSLPYNQLRHTTNLPTPRKL